MSHQFQTYYLILRMFFLGSCNHVPPMQAKKRIRDCLVFRGDVHTRNDDKRSLQTLLISNYRHLNEWYTHRTPSKILVLNSDKEYLYPVSRLTSELIIPNSNSFSYLESNRKLCDLMQRKQEIHNQSYLAHQTLSIAHGEHQWRKQKNKKSRKQKLRKVERTRIVPKTMHRRRENAGFPISGCECEYIFNTHLLF